MDIEQAQFQVKKIPFIVCDYDLSKRRLARRVGSQKIDYMLTFEAAPFSFSSIHLDEAQQMRTVLPWTSRNFDAKVKREANHRRLDHDPLLANFDARRWRLDAS